MSQVKGVYKCGKKWKSQIQVNGKQHYLGIFDTVELAQESYQAANLRFRGKAVGASGAIGISGKGSGDGSSSSSSSTSGNSSRTSSRGGGVTTTLSQAAVAVSGEREEGETEDEDDDGEGHSPLARARPVVLHVQNQAEKAMVEAKVRLGLILSELLAANNHNNNMDMTDTDIEKYYTELTQLLTTLRYIRN